MARLSSCRQQQLVSLRSPPMERLGWPSTPLPVFEWIWCRHAAPRGEIRLATFATSIHLFEGIFPTFLSWPVQHEGDKVIVFERAVIPFICSMSYRARACCGSLISIPRTGSEVRYVRSDLLVSFTDYRVGINEPGEYRLVLNTDSKAFDGQDRIDPSGKYFTTDLAWNNRKNFLQGMRTAEISRWPAVYIPSRVAIVLARVS